MNRCIFFEESYVFLLQGQADEEEEPLDTEEEGSTILRKYLPNVTRSHQGLTTFSASTPDLAMCFFFVPHAAQQQITVHLLYAVPTFQQL